MSEKNHKQICPFTSRLHETRTLKSRLEGIYILTWWIMTKFVISVSKSRHRLVILRYLRLVWYSSHFKCHIIVPSFSISNLPLYPLFSLSSFSGVKLLLMFDCWIQKFLTFCWLSSMFTKTCLILSWFTGGGYQRIWCTCTVSAILDMGEASKSYIPSESTTNTSRGSTISNYSTS